MAKTPSIRLRKPPWRRRGFSLLELVLALSLSVVILAAVGMAIDVHLRSFHSRRDVLEESQLARAILKIIADDIRNVVVNYEQDVSSVEAMLQGSAAGLLGGGGSPSGGEPGGGEPGGGEPGGGELEMGETSELLEEVESLNTTDLANAAALPAVPGLYGNQFELQIDVSRLPRIDEYQVVLTDPNAALVDIPSDIKTVTYFVQTGVDAVTAAALNPLGEGDLSGAGLVRRELDRAVTEWAMLNGSAMSLLESGELIAPEVVGLQFQYFDGYEWRTEWDTEYEETLPLAVEILLMIQTPDPAVGGQVDPLSATSNAAIRYYRLVVHLPVGAPVETLE